MDAKTPEPVKTRVRSGLTKADPFAEFADWLVNGPVGVWLSFLKDEELSNRQKRIVAANAKLLRDRKKWQEKVAAFEAALAAIADDEVRAARRGDYAIHFDWHDFGDGYKDFKEYRFPCSASFAMATFGAGIVSFEGATFGDGNVSFSGAKFSKGTVLFDGATFGRGEVSFDEATFGDGSVSFDEVTFGDGDVYFYKTTFGNGSVSFNGTVFNDSYVYFDEATFDDVFFYETTFAILIASGMIVAGNLFVEAKFCKYADFNRLKVGGTADFSGSTFAKVPDFRDAKLDQPPEVARMVVPPPKLKRSDLSLFRVAADLNDVAKYRRLKAMALAANDHEKDGEFFAYEMLAKRGVETTTFFGLLFNTLYHQLGNFGQSYLRPLAWMAASFAFFAFAYRAIIGAAGGWPTNLLFALEISFRNSVPLFGALFKAIPAPKDHKSAFDRMFATLSDAGVNMDLIGWIGMAQSLFGGVLLFMLLLALRNKFRLK